MQHRKRPHMSEDPYHQKELTFDPANNRYRVTTERGTWQFPAPYVRNGALYPCHVLDSIHGEKNLRKPGRPPQWSDAEVVQMRFDYSEGLSLHETATKYGSTSGYVSLYVRGKRRLAAGGPIAISQRAKKRLPRKAVKALLAAALKQRHECGTALRLGKAADIVAANDTGVRPQKRRYLRMQQVLATSGRLINRLWSRVDKSAGPTGCWIWTGYLRRRSFTTRYGERHEYQTPMIVGVDGKSLVPVRQMVASLCGRPLAPRQRAVMTCSNPDRCVQILHFKGRA